MGTGVGFGISDAQGSAVDASSPQGLRSHLLNGAPVSGAAYSGIWRNWLEQPGARNEKVDEVMSREFAGESKPWRMPWVSLVLGRRGMELAEAVHGCPEPNAVTAAEDSKALDTDCDAEAKDESCDLRATAVRAYAEQWLHFLHTLFIPQFSGGTRRHRVERICFSGGVAEVNGDMLREALVQDASGLLRPLPASIAAAAKAAATDNPKRGKAVRQRTAEADPDACAMRVLPTVPHGAGLIGAGIYALAGLSGVAMSIWAP